MMTYEECVDVINTIVSGVNEGEPPEKWLDAAVEMKEETLNLTFKSKQGKEMRILNAPTCHEMCLVHHISKCLLLDLGLNRLWKDVD